MPRSTTHRAARILDMDQSTTINTTLDAINHNITMQFEQIALNQTPVKVVYQTTSWCGVFCSGAHVIELCEANLNFVKYVGNAQRGGGQQNLEILITLVGETILTFLGEGTKTKITHKVQINTVPKGMGNNTKITTKT